MASKPNKYPKIRRAKHARPTAPERTTLPLAKLREHPLQATFFAAPSEMLDDELRTSLETEGQRDSIVVMPPRNAAGLAAYTILDGHRRAAALMQLGTKVVTVTIRHDLRHADAAIVEAAFLQFNFGRRQLDIIETAKIAARLHHLECQRQGRSTINGQGPRDRVGKLLGISGRQVARLLTIAFAPPEIQAAVRAGRLGQLLAERFATLNQETRNLIIARISELTSRKEVEAVVREYVVTVPRRIKLDSKIRKLSESLDTVNHLQSRFPTMRGIEWLEFLPSLETGQTTLAKLVDRIRSITQDGNP